MLISDLIESIKALIVQKIFFLEVGNLKLAEIVLKSVYIYINILSEYSGSIFEL